MTQQPLVWDVPSEDQMATEKLSEGIRKFNADFQKLKDVVRSKLQG